MEISVKLPNNLYKDVSQLAKTKKKSVATIIKNAVRKAVSEETPVSDTSLAHCSGDEVLVLANMKMPKEQADWQSELLYKNQAGTITPLERN